MLRPHDLAQQRCWSLSSAAHWPNGRLQSNYVYARAGLNIKRINGNVREGVLWSTLDAISHLDPFNVSDTKWYLDCDYKPNVTTVCKDDSRTSWVVGGAYHFHVSCRPIIGYIQVRIFRPSVSNTIPYLDTGAVYVQPSTATTGRIGLDTYTQSAVTFDSVDFSCCDGFTDASCNYLSYTACPSGQAEAFSPTFNSNRVCVPDGKPVPHLLDVFVCALL